MNDPEQVPDYDLNGSAYPSHPSASHGASLQVQVGNALPSMSGAGAPQVQPVVLTDVIQGLPSRSMVAEGMQFTGSAQLRGPCSIAGVVEGNLTQAPGSEAAVVVTETGRVKGDITAVKISVMGQTDGVLDALPHWHDHVRPQVIEALTEQINAHADWLENIGINPGPCSAQSGHDPVPHRDNDLIPVPVPQLAHHVDAHTDGRENVVVDPRPCSADG